MVPFLENRHRNRRVLTTTTVLYMYDVRVHDIHITYMYTMQMQIGAKGAEQFARIFYMYTCMYD